jgi:phosphoribosylformylglycinamidine synthase
LYNETSGNAIFPTPMIGMVGLLGDVSDATGQWFRTEGDLVALLGETREELGASEYLAIRFGLVQGAPPSLDLAREWAVQRVCLEAIRAGIVRSAHDCSDGGLAIALAESCLGPTPIGVDVQLTDTIRPDALLFGESQSRIVISLKPSDWPRLKTLAAVHQVPVARLGTVGGTGLTLRAPACGIDLSLTEVEAAWRGGLASALGA